MCKNTSISLEFFNDYQIGDFFLATPERTLLGKGSFYNIFCKNKKDNSSEFLAEQVLAAFKSAKEHGFSNPVVVGAIPFDYKKGARLIVPEKMKISPPLRFDSGVASISPVLSGFEVIPEPEPSKYMDGVEKGLQYIASGQLSKIVLSRTLQLTSHESVDIHQLLYNLLRHNPHGYTFAVNLSDNVSDESNSKSTLKKMKTLIGASPELLISKSGLQLTANPLAGSRPRSENPATDQRLAEELLSSAKDLHEHAVVVRAVAAALKPFCRTLEVPDKPSLVCTDTIWHLSSKITGEIKASSVSSLELALALHPTPAVCGTPTDQAREAIYKIESFDRNYFTGVIGWCDANGDGEWVVTIRCAEAEGNSMRLYAGAGVVSGSNPKGELMETAVKFRTMLSAMGIEKEEI
jgi:isochorismate synthase